MKYKFFKYAYFIEIKYDLLMKNTVLISLFTAIVGVLGFVPPFSVGVLPVPIILQNMGFMLAGSILGSKRGFLVGLLFVFFVLIGMPLLSGGRGGLSVFLGPSVGFIIGFPFVAFLVGFMNEKLWIKHNFVRLLLANILSGIIFAYILGVPIMAIIAKMEFSKAFLLSFTWLGGDVLKCIFATWIGLETKKYLKDLI